MTLESLREWAKGQDIQAHADRRIEDAFFWDDVERLLSTLVPMDEVVSDRELEKRVEELEQENFELEDENNDLKRENDQLRENLRESHFRKD